MAEKCIPTSTILASFIIQIFCDISLMLLLFDKPLHSVLTISNPFKILCILALLTLSAQHITHQSLTHIREISHESFTIPFLSQVNFQTVEHNMKNLFIYDFNIISVTFVLLSLNLLKHLSSINKLFKNFFIIFFNFSLISNSSDLFCPAHSFSLVIFFTFTEQGNCNLHSHT